MNLVFILIIIANFYSLNICLESFTDYNVFKRFCEASINCEGVSHYAKANGFPHFDDLFNEFKIKYKKKYKNSAEEEMRKFNLMKALIAIENNKKGLNDGLVVHELSLNDLADLSTDEFFQQRYDWPEDNMQSIGTFKNPVFILSNSSLGYNRLPEMLDWRIENVVTRVKNQGKCGSCWAFGGIATIESAFAIKRNLKFKPLVELSEQQIIDCVSGEGYYSFGCKGGAVFDVFEYAINHGVVKEIDYPYTEKKNVCQNVSNLWRLKIIDYEFYYGYIDDNEIMDLIYQNGPIAVMINAGDFDFLLYSNGIITNAGNQTIINSQTNHIVTVVGWGVETGVHYWIVKNSYGADWGESGYFRLKRGINSRGFNSIVFYPIVGQNLVEDDHPIYLPITDIEHDKSSGGFIINHSLAVLTAFILFINFSHLKLIFI